MATALDKHIDAASEYRCYSEDLTRGPRLGLCISLLPFAPSRTRTMPGADPPKKEEASKDGKKDDKKSAASKLLEKKKEEVVIPPTPKEGALLRFRHAATTAA